MKTIRLAIVMLVLSAMGLLASVTAAQDECLYYVAPDGDDAAPGTATAPWATLQYAANNVQPGAVVCIQAGDYTLADGIVDFTVTGTAEQPIVFLASEGATLRGGLNLRRGVSYLRLEGFTLTDFPIWGITLYGDNTNITLTGLAVMGGEAGIHFTYGYSGEAPEEGPVSDITLEDSRISGAFYTAIDCTPGPCNNMIFRRLEIAGPETLTEGNFGADGLAIERGQNILVEDCYIHDNGGDGIDLNSRDVPIQADAGEIIVQNNVVANNLRNGIKLWRGGWAENNLVWNSGEENLVLVEGSDYTIINNTFANRATYGYLALLGDATEVSEDTTVTLVNNLFYNDNPEMGGTLIYIAAGVEFQADYNLYFNPYREEDVICVADDYCVNKDQINDGSWFTLSGADEHGLYADPLFMDAAAGDFRLSEGSPALGVGSPDYAPDLGAAAMLIPTAE